MGNRTDTAAHLARIPYMTIEDDKGCDAVSRAVKTLLTCIMKDNL